MVNALGKIFWGLLLTVLDLRISGVDILPDFIGCILVATGCVGLSSFSRRFLIAARLAWGAFIFSVVAYALSGKAVVVFVFLATVLDLTMMWFLLGGYMDLVSSKGRMDMHHLAERRRREYLVASSLATVIFLLIPRGGVLTGLMSMVLFICLLVVLCLILQLTHRMKIELVDEKTG